MTEFIISIFLVVLAGDLLYLYYSGAWWDPKRWIEKTEVICLYAFVVGGIANCIKCIVELLG